MRFEYNSDLIYNDRVKLVANEIVDVYPEISYDDAMKAAAHAVPIDDKPSNDDKFDRYYFILRTIGKNHKEFISVLKDAYNVFTLGLQNDMYKDSFASIVNYVILNGVSFPELSDFY